MFKRSLILICFLIFFVSCVSGEILESCGTLSAGNSYTLDEDLFANLDSTCITASGDNSILDCQGNSIIGDQSNTQSFKYGIYIPGENVTIKNCIFENWTAFNNFAGFITGPNSKIYNVTIKSNTPSIRYFTGSNGGYIENITLEGTSELYLYGDAGDIEINNIDGNIYAINTNDNITINNWTKSSSSSINFKATNSYINRINFSDMSSPLTFYGNATIVNNSYFLNYSGTLSFLDNYSSLLNTQMINSTGRINVGEDIYDFEINNLTMNNVTGTIFSLGFDSPKNLKIVNSNFIDVSRIYIYNNVGNTESSNFNISNNHFNCSEFGLTDIDIHYANFNSTIKGNVLKNVEFLNSMSFNSTYDSNQLFNSSITLRSANNTNFSNNYLNTSYFKSGYSNEEKSYNLNVFNNYVFSHLDSHTIDMFKTVGFNVYNNTCNETFYCISTDNSQNGLIYNNSGVSTYDGAHGIMINQNTSNVSAYNNIISNMSFGFLFEYGSYNNSIWNNTMQGGIFYSLHDTHNNKAYDNYINGELYLRDNVTNEFFYNNTITGNIFLDWDLELGPEGTGAYGNNLSDLVMGGELIMSGNSTDNILVNVSWEGNEIINSENVSSYIRKWYLDASTNVDNTNITIVNSTGNVIYSNLISDSIHRQVLISYINEGGTITNYSNYTITASAEGYSTNTTDFNLTDNIEFNFRFLAEEEEENATEYVFVVDADRSGGGSGNLRFYPKEKDLNEGYKKKMGEEWEIRFKFKNETHKLIVEELKENSTVISVSSEKQTKEMSIGDEWMVNLDGDGYYDYLVELINMSASRAEISIKKINKEVEEESKKLEEKEDLKQTEETEITNESVDYEEYIIAYGFVIAFIVFLVVYFVRRNSKIN